MFLALADYDITPWGTQDGRLEELHFLSSVKKTGRRTGVPEHLMVELRTDEPRDFRRAELRCYASSEESEIRAKWNRAVKAALEINRLHLLFDEHSNNCRTGTKAALAAMGLEFVPARGYA